MIEFTMVVGVVCGVLLWHLWGYIILVIARPEADSFPFELLNPIWLYKNTKANVFG